jgi:hypothetical protein
VLAGTIDDHRGESEVGRAVQWTVGIALGVVATAAAAAPATEGPNIAFILLIVMGCAALALLRWRA